jgi:putative ABC transport system permease protein
MAELTKDHTDYIIKDLHYRGVVAEGIEQEMIDHICSATEAEMEKGKKFIEAYHEVLKSFGHTSGLREIQKQTLKVENQKATIMLKNYLTIAFRNLRKQSFYSFINIGGLAVGVAACLVIVLFIIDELSYDKYNTKADRIYRLDNEIKFGGNYYHINTSSAPAAQTLLQDYPEIESTVRFRRSGS